jgi:hypothetical protein
VKVTCAVAVEAASGARAADNISAPKKRLLIE